MNKINFQCSNIFIFLITASSLLGILSCENDKISESEIENSLSIDKPTNFLATPKDGANALSWENPNPSDIVGFLVIRNEINYPNDSLDGVEIFRGLSNEFLDAPIENGKRYFYAIYSFDNQNNFSVGAFT